MNKAWAAVGLAVGLAGAAAGPAHAGAADRVRALAGLHTLATLWSAEATPAFCMLGRTLNVSAAPIAGRSGGFRHSGELVAEIVAPEPLVARVASQARVCADQAAEAIAVAAAASQDRPAPAGFAAGMDACLRRAHVAAYLGAVTLWIDSDCAL
jgi:hypothetical protein